MALTPTEFWTYLFVALTFGAYLFIGYTNRVRDTKGFYVAQIYDYDTYLNVKEMAAIANDYIWIDLTNTDGVTCNSWLECHEKLYDHDGNKIDLSVMSIDNPTITVNGETCIRMSSTGNLEGASCSGPVAKTLCQSKCASKIFFLF